MNASQILERLRDDAFLEAVRTSLQEAGADDEALVDETVRWVDGVRGDLAELVELVGDDDAGMVCAVRLVELKARWIALNTRVNYGLMRGHGFEPEAPLRGAALSALIEALDDLLPERHVEAFHALLAEPLTSRPLRMLDEVWNDAVKPRPVFTPARKAKGVGSARTRKNRGRRLAA